MVSKLFLSSFFVLFWVFTVYFAPVVSTQKGQIKGKSNIWATSLWQILQVSWTLLEGRTLLFQKKCWCFDNGLSWVRIWFLIVLKNSPSICHSYSSFFIYYPCCNIGLQLQCIHNLSSFNELWNFFIQCEHIRLWLQMTDIGLTGPVNHRNKKNSPSKNQMEPQMQQLQHRIVSRRLCTSYTKGQVRVRVVHPEQDCDLPPCMISCSTNHLSQLHSLMKTVRSIESPGSELVDHWPIYFVTCTIFEGL